VNQRAEGASVAAAAGYELKRGPSLSVTALLDEAQLRARQKGAGQAAAGKQTEVKPKEVKEVAAKEVKELASSSLKDGQQESGFHAEGGGGGRGGGGAGGAGVAGGGGERLCLREQERIFSHSYKGDTRELLPTASTPLPVSPAIPLQHPPCTGIDAGPGPWPGARRSLEQALAQGKPA
jgi:hypothetical protein